MKHFWMVLAMFSTAALACVLFFGSPFLPKAKSDIVPTPAIADDNYTKAKLEGERLGKELEALRLEFVAVPSRAYEALKDGSAVNYNKFRSSALADAQDKTMTLFNKALSVNTATKALYEEELARIDKMPLQADEREALTRETTAKFQNLGESLKKHLQDLQSSLEQVTDVLKMGAKE